MGREKDESVLFTRILVAADTSIHSRTALQEAVRLAASLKAELEALFVEDINLIRLAGLPLAGVFQASASGEGGVDLSRMDRALKAQARQLRAILETLAEKSQVRCSFRIVRGSVSSELLSASQESDLISAGWTGAGVGSSSRPGSTALEMIRKSTRSVLLLRAGGQFLPPFWVFYDKSPGVSRTLAVAAGLSRGYEGALRLLFLSDSPVLTEELKRRAEEDLAKLGEVLPVRFRELPSGVDGLARFLKSYSKGVLILAGDSPLLETEKTLQLLAQSRNPLLVVR